METKKINKSLLAILGGYFTILILTSIIPWIFIEVMQVPGPSRMILLIIPGALIGGWIATLIDSENAWTNLSVLAGLLIFQAIFQNSGNLFHGEIMGTHMLMILTSPLAAMAGGAFNLWISSKKEATA